MSKMKYDRPNSGYEKLVRHLLVDATPNTLAAKRANKRTKRRLKAQKKSQKSTF